MLQRHSLRTATTARRIFLILALSMIALMFVVGAAAKLTSAFFAEGDISVIKTGPDTAMPDTDVTYTITVLTSGPDDTVGAQLTDNLPSGMTFVSVDSTGAPGWLCPEPSMGNPLICTKSTSPAGSTDVITLTVHIAPDSPPGTFFTNIAIVSGSPNDTPENDSSTASTQIPSNETDLAITKTGPSQVHPDSDVTYTITVTNGGSNTATNPQFTDTLPNSSTPSGFQMSFVSFSQTSGPAWDNCTTPTPCQTMSLAPGSTSTFTLVGHVPAGTPDGAQYTNQVALTSDADPNSENDSVSSLATVLGCFTNQVVTTSADNGAGSLRQAILDACSVGSTITFDMTQVVSPITLSTGELIVDKNVTITGPGASLLTVDANQTSRVFNIGAGKTAGISGLTVANGKVVDSAAGGGIYIDTGGALTLTDSTLSGNSSSTLSGAMSSGGGIANLGTLTIINSTLSGNFASGGTTSGSSGGGIANSGTVTITNSTLSGNSASNGSPGNNGGGIQNSGTVTITSSTLSGNFASGGASASGGGILNTGTVTITNSTLSGNSASTSGGTSFGGGITSGGGSGTTLTITNSTISGNSVSGGSDQGGGIYNGGTVNIRSTIIAQNTATTSGPDFQGTLNSQGHNLIGNQSGAMITGDTTGNLPDGTNPLLGPLQNNGGPTQTMALLVGSPALDAGDNCVLDNSCMPALDGPITTDQRGFERQIDGPDADTTATVDIGAFEAQVSLQDITDKTTSEDTQLQFDFNVGGNVTSVTATSSNPAVAPDPSASGSGSLRTLTINPVANQFGTTTITVTVNGINGQSMTDTFVLIVSPVGDTPSVTGASTTVNTQSTSGLVITRNVIDGAEITYFKITNITNGTLFKNDGATQINNGDFIMAAEGNAGLKFTPALNSTANGSFDVQAATGIDEGVGNAATATITVSCGPTVVTTNADSGAGSLRDVILHACSGATITFTAGLASPITLTSSQLVIDKNLTITGPGASLLTISGNNARRVFNITTGSTVSITDLTIANGRITSGGVNHGGAIFNAGTLTLTNDTISNSNTTGGSNAGGGIFNAVGATMLMTGSSVSSNTAQGGVSDQGGGIANLGALTITNSTIQGNSAVLANGPGAPNRGGGVYNEGTLTVISSSVESNQARSNSSAISTTQGGGIFSLGNATITSSTLEGNAVSGNIVSPAAGGGVCSLTNKLVVVNSTIANNQVVNGNTNSGGGIENGSSSTLVLVSSTVAANAVAGGGGAAGGGVRTIGPANVRNTIIANNFSTTSLDVDGTFNSQGHNLIQIISGSSGFGVNGDITGVDPLLNSLGDYGGPTQTMALRAGSPALDAGDNCVLDVAHCSDPDTPQLTFDQRGTPFARSVDGPDADATAVVDIGAFEAQVSIEDIPDKTINEDGQLQFTFNIGGGANVTNVLVVSSTNTTLVPNNAANLALTGSGSTRTLTINPVANLFGTATILVNVIGANSQQSDTFVLTVNPVPDTPSVTNASTTVNTQTTSGLVISRSPADGSEITHFKITNITGGTLFKNDGTTQINNGSFITFAEGNAGLKFTPPLNSTADGSFQVQASLSNNDSGLGGGIATATISVNCGSTVVINSNDSGAGSLRDTILHACDGATITFDLTPGKVASPITLTSGELLMNKNLVIQGPNANILTVQRSAVAGTPLFSIFNVPSGLSLGVSGLTLSNADNPNNGGAIKNAGTLNLNSMALTNNHTAAAGSALFNAQTGSATVTNTTFSNNNSDQFAAIYNQGGMLNLTNSTLSANANASNFPGAAIFSESFAGVTNITNCTIAQNTGQTEVVWRNGNSGALINLKNTIVSGNAGGNVNGTTDLGNNLIGGNALLAALGNYGGPTQTMALLPGSPALNAGTATGAPTTDQRGISRVGAVDIGAFESRGFTITAASGTPQSATILSAFGSPLVATIGGVGGEPVNGGIVTFTAPASGASAVLTGGSAIANVTINAGQASINATANGVAGSYNVNASAVGATSTLFSLTNNKAATTTTITSSVNPSDLNQSVTFTATVAGVLTPTGTVQFKDNGSNLGAPVALNSSGVAQLTTSALTAGNHTITADYSGDANLLASTGTLAGGQTVAFRPLIKFSQPTYSVNENGNVITITVIRQGDASAAVTVDYTTTDDSAALTVLPCSNANGVASPRCDFTTALGTLRFAAGETSKTFNILISQDLWLEGNETAQLTLSNPTGGAAFQQPSDALAVLTIVDDDTSSPATNPIDDSTTFVRQHYHDFLNREPDTTGLNFWVGQIESCGADAQCRAVKRINVSAAFFLSIEFQNTGYFVERMYKAGFGDIAPPTVPVPVRFTNFLADGQEIKGNIIVGQGNWQQQIDDAKKAFALGFVHRVAFMNRYPALTSATAFVDSLNANAGLVLSDSERADLIAELTPNPADAALRADVLQKVAENQVLFQREFNRAFVLMQYFGYLRRNPDAAPEPTLNFGGYNFWLGKLNQANGDYIGAELIKAFITSSEYRGRFGP
jgi:uncharacterized repeat protein (TIGR01451 family)